MAALHRLCALLLPTAHPQCCLVPPQAAPARGSPPPTKTASVAIQRRLGPGAVGGRVPARRVAVRVSQQARHLPVRVCLACLLLLCMLQYPCVCCQTSTPPSLRLDMRGAPVVAWLGELNSA